MSDPDSLVATRARRANAGSRLKQLIELEEQASGVQNIIYSEEDETVQLLFQEDENDQEFEESDTDTSGHEGDEGNENERDDPAIDIELEVGEKDSMTPELELLVNSDEMLSDSDISVSENDDSEGERELQKKEREKKRKIKSNLIIPAIKKPKPVIEKPKPKIKTKHSELLLNIDRRASSRKSAMKNKEILVQKLKEDETRRATLTPIVRVDEVKLTQEERLAQAVETEKENVRSLHSFLQQEVVKKEHQKLLFQQRRPKLRNVIRLYSREIFVAPIDEIEDAWHVQDLFEKKKKGRRRKPGSDVSEGPRPGNIDTELPYYKKEMEEKRMREEKEAKEKEEREEKRRKSIEQEEKRRRELEDERESRRLAKEERFKEFENVDATKPLAKASKLSEFSDDSLLTGLLCESRSPTQSSNVMDTEGNMPDLPATQHENIIDHTEHMETNPNGNLEENRAEEEEEDVSDNTEVQFSQKEGTEKPNHFSRQNCADELNDPSNNSVMEDITSLLEGSASNIEPVLNLADKIETTKLQLTNNSGDGHSEEITVDGKKVKFAFSEEEEADQSMDLEQSEVPEPDDEFETSNAYRADKGGSIYEGPVQHVGRNDIILINFDDEHNPNLSEMRVKTILFGKDANLGASRRFKDVKTILKSSIRLENPYSAPMEEEENDLLKPVTDISEEDTMFEALKRLPRLGVKETFEEEEEDVKKEETTEIQIRTEAPSGLYLPNGNKKLCLISGREARYFDPTTGLPYENKDVYKIIKTIEQGLIPWYSIGRDQNTYGDLQIYLNHRNGSRHAKGVPEGFDGF